MQQGLATTRAMGAILGERWSLAPLAEVYGVGVQTAEGLRLNASKNYLRYNPGVYDDVHLF